MRSPLFLPTAVTILLANGGGVGNALVQASARPPADARPSAGDGAGWWPVQATAAAIVNANTPNDSPSPRASYEMTLQSVAGLAAKAVNEGRGDEMVWVNTDNVDYD